jgi:hypothetical protein
MVTQILLIMMSEICVNLCNLWTIVIKEEI